MYTIHANVDECNTQNKEEASRTPNTDVKILDHVHSTFTSKLSNLVKGIRAWMDKLSMLSMISSKDLLAC